MDVLNGLQLTPFEWTMTTACSSSPMEFFIRLTGSGTLDTPKFENAVVSALKHQPLLQANLVVGPTHRLSQWRPATNTTPQFIWLTDAPTPGHGFPGDFKSIDLSTEIGVRLYGWSYQIENEDRFELKFVFHHACCDGKGAVSFIEHVLRRYQSLLSGKPTDNDSQIEINAVTQRDARATKRLSFAQRVRKSLALRPKRAWNMLTKKPAAILTGQPASTLAYTQPPTQCSSMLDLETTRRLGKFANEQQTTVNSVLVSSLFATLHDFLQETSKDRINRARSIRVLIPFSLRDQRHQNMPAANCVSMAYLEASPNQLKSDGLTDHVTRQTQFIRDWQLQYAWIEAIDSYTRLWPVIKLLKGRRTAGTTPHAEKPIATTVLSNLGGVFKGSKLETDDGRIKIDHLTNENLTIDSVHLVLPCTAAIPINFSVNFYSGRLSLDVTYLQSIVEEKIPADLLDRWEKSIVQAISS